MFYKLYIGFFFFMFGLTNNFLFAQINYIDYNPQYKTWSATYQIDKIEFTSQHTIIHFRFAKNNSQYDSPTFYASKGTFAWVLETEAGMVYPQQKLTNIAKNGLIQLEILEQEQHTISALTKEKTEHTFFTCQIYFERLPENLEKISLVEGRGNKSHRNHLNCLDINLKNEEIKEASEVTKRIQNFEQQINNSKQSFVNDKPLKAPKRVAIDATPKNKSQKGDFSIEYIEDRFEHQKKEGEIQKSLDELISDDLDAYKNRGIIDPNPIYRPWKKDYILHKVIYTKTEIIFLLLFRFPTHGSVSSALFYSSNSKHPWFLKDAQSGKKYDFKAVTDIKQNGVLKLKKLSDFPLRLETDANQEVTFFSCQVHFERLPPSVNKVHLIEGRKKSKDTNHFNFFDIKLIHPYFK
ncbi:hypothetical protein [Aureispira anguillae]|uniref:Uncharacterized protein n=1 Tax=Aureispira anguillae TaxID=2864201 RepID=A0A915YBC5_9BACT|nr:hypothetical protein [Aureispira anguillae]BDS09945.1 hypothetical protein AsAng_0006500 [Aureispira anguillae]